MKKLLWLMMAALALEGCGGSSSSKGDSSPKPEPVVVPPPASKADFIGFESAPVRPLAMNAAQDRLYVTNTSNHSLEVYKLDAAGLPSLLESVPVGMEPVSVALADDNTVWVVNHLSDSISVVDVSQNPARVVRTLLVGDEPRDLVFANGHAFVTTAHRGQHRTSPTLAAVPGAGDPQLHTPGVPRADVWVFDADNPGTAMGGVPRKIISLFGDNPRGLAVSPDQKTVYAAVLNSGNQTSVVHEGVLCYGFEDDEWGSQPCQVMDGISSPAGLEEGWLPGGRTAPGVNVEGLPQPWTSMIVQYDPVSGEWQDTKGRNFSNGIRFSLPDKDVFAIDATTLTEKAAYPHVGTTLFNMAVNPVSGELMVTNTESNNATRFEGPGVFGGSTVQGNLARTRITVINPDSGQVKPRHLNKHIDYSQVKSTPQVRKHSLSTPTQLAVTRDGKKVYMAAMGSNRVAVLPTQTLSSDTLWQNFDPSKASSDYINVRGGPVGLSLNEADNKLYVFTRYDNALVTLNSTSGQEISRQTMATQEPESFQAGRFMLYDADRTSSNGEASCASCHIFGDTDHLSWNLGNPDERNKPNPQPFPTRNTLRLGCDLVGPDESSCQTLQVLNGDGNELTIAAMKGPMTTQTLRGTSTHGHMHWRGDRASGYFGNDTAQTLDERMSFKNFIVAYEGLVGLDIELPESVKAANKPDEVKQLEQDMDKFADFMLSVALPPNPIRGLDNSLSASAAIGSDFFHGSRRSDGLPTDVDFNGPSRDGVNCEGCHGVDHAKGFYGTRGEAAHGGEILILKVPQLRNLYTRVGMFGLPDREDFLPSHTREFQGEQIRGFGFLHDGATDQLVNFLRGGVFDNGEEDCPPGVSEAHGCEFNQGFVGIPDETVREGLVDYLMEFDNDLAPIVGQQITLSPKTGKQVAERLDLLERRAATAFTSKILGGKVTECDLVARGVVDGARRGYFYHPETRRYRSDKSTEAMLSSEQIRTLAQANGNALTFTCTVPGAGWKLALDTNLNGRLNGDE